MFAASRQARVSGNYRPLRTRGATASCRPTPRVPLAPSSERRCCASARSSTLRPRKLSLCWLTRVDGCHIADCGAERLRGGASQRSLPRVTAGAQGRRSGCRTGAAVRAIYRHVEAHRHPDPPAELISGGSVVGSGLVQGAAEPEWSPTARCTRACLSSPVVPRLPVENRCVRRA